MAAGKKKSCKKKRKLVKNKSTKKSRSKKNPIKKKHPKEKKKGVVGTAVGKIPENVKIKGGKYKSRSRNKYGSVSVESEYKDLNVGKK